MANALTLALFGAQAFGEHVPCLSALGHNLTARFEALFFAGFILHACIFSIQTYVDPYFRGFLAKNERDARVMSYLCLFMEWFLHLLVLVLSLITILLTQFGK